MHPKKLKIRYTKEWRLSSTTTTKSPIHPPQYIFVAPIVKEWGHPPPMLPSMHLLFVGMVGWLLLLFAHFCRHPSFLSVSSFSREHLLLQMFFCSSAIFRIFDLIPFYLSNFWIKGTNLFDEHTIKI